LNLLTGLFLVVVIFYLIEHVIYVFGLSRAVREPEGYSKEGEPSQLCTVLVCARDEEDNIGPCLASLEALNYPKERLEVLIVDDKSTDRTPEILEAWKARMPNLKVLRTGEAVMNLQGKVNALTQGMDAASGEIVMITDADSTVPPNWVKEYLKYYTEDTGMVASITLLEQKYFFGALQSIDWSYLLGMACAAANIKIPLSVIGNNISVRRAAYESVGGYREIPFSVTEDHALFEAIWNKKRTDGAPMWKVSFPLHPDLVVMSEPCPDFRSWWRQKHRWVKGGEGLKFVGYVIFILGLLAQLAMVTAFIVLPFPIAITTVAIKWSADFLVIFPVLTRTRKLSLLKYFPVYEIYLALFVFSMPIMLAQKNVKWKGRVYRN
jgi:cellulose synthase/poly-beta-1,6-N-acetylglucosamine synthase-like glycosyltransferase